MAGILVLEPFEHLILDVALVWGDCSLVKITVSDPLEHSGLGETDDVDLDSLWMAPWDACGMLGAGSRPGIAIWRDVLCCIARLSRMLVLPLTGYSRSFRGLGRTCILDLNAGESKAPVRIMGDERQTDFPRPQGCTGNGFSLGEPYPGREVRGRIGLSPGEPYPGRVLRGRTGLFKAGFVGRIASICVNSDWVTPFRISPQTCMGLLPIDVALSSAV